MREREDVTRRRALGLAISLALAGIACTAAGAPAPEAPSASVSSSREERWAEDIAYLVERMEAVHPDLYHGVSPDELHRAADDLLVALPTSSDCFSGRDPVLETAVNASTASDG